MLYLVSACLAGVACRYDGTAAAHPFVMQLMEQGKALPACPECLGGLFTPRAPCECQQDRVIASNGIDCTAAFQKGAEAVLELAKNHGCTAAILKARSPSCGMGRIYDGTFTHTLIEGHGVCAALLLGAGLPVYNEENLPPNTLI